METIETAPTKALKTRPRQVGPWRIEDIIDPRALRVKLTAAIQMNSGDAAKSRKQVVDTLHGALFRGRMIAQERLNQGADGLDTARLLSAVQDQVLHALYDYTTTHVFRARNPTEGERLAVFAVGGYGRSVMAPSSDVDLLFIRSYKASAHAESVIEYMLYILWDIGLKVGHAFRTPPECIRLAREDVTIKTSLLDARFLFGDQKLADEMLDLFREKSIQGQDAAFIADKLAERDGRHGRQGNTRYVVEPNLKEGKGGLRDLQTLFWIVKHMNIDRTRTLEDVVRTELFTHHETILFMRAARFLWTVRCHLHFLTGRPEERLSFDLQPELANRMGYFDRAGQLGVERFMKRYFIAAKDVGGLTRILAAKLESQEKAKPRGLRRFLGADGKQVLPGGEFSIVGGRICISEDDQFLTRPANLIRLFKTADETGMDIHPNAMSLVARNVRRITPQARRDPDTVTAFLDILLDGKSPGIALTRMNETGVLGRFIPEFGGIVAQTQFNMYHHYTVDEHTLRAVSHIADMESGEPGFELAQRLIGLVKNRRALYLAMLLHDTGKGKGDQQIEGMVTARAACQRFGLSDTETDLVAWLVGNHLEMSESAQKRDISDPRTIGKFADLVGNLERMRLLYILTVADIRAVGPNVWNAWKGQLLADLYFGTEAVLRGGRTDEKTVLNEISRRANSHRAEVAEAIEIIPPILAEMEDPYWTGFDSETIILHAKLLAAGRSPTVNVRVREDAGGTEVFVSAADRKGLFARLVSAIDGQEANIISAQVFTGKSGAIVDVFVLQNETGEPFAMNDPYRLERLEKAIYMAVETDAAIPEPRVRSNSRQAAFLVEPSVCFNEDESDQHTVLDVAGRDRPGLLADVSKVLADAGVSVLSAHVGSYGERVFDAFYVRLPEGYSAMWRADLNEKLLAALSDQEPDAPSTPVGKLRRASAADSF